MMAATATAQAQQMPHYTQYILNQYIVNPAITGIENYTDIKLSHRHQWAGIEDAPVTTYFTMHLPIGKTDYRTTPTSFDMPGENPWGKRYWESYTAAEPHHGAGIQVMNDRTGPLGRTSIYLTYAYHLGLSPQTSISAGFGAGIFRQSLDASKLDFGTGTQDPAVYNNDEISRVRPDLSAGLYLYSANFFAGLSAQQVVPQRYNFSNNAVTRESGRMVPHLFAATGFRMAVGEDFNLIPSVLVKYISPTPVQFDLNAKLQYHDLAWVGASYRLKDGYCGMLGLHVSNTFNISYSYDHTTSGLNSYARGTHELMMGFLIGNQYADNSPRNVW